MLALAAESGVGVEATCPGRWAALAPAPEAGDVTTPPSWVESGKLAWDEETFCLSEEVLEVLLGVLEWIPACSSKP